MMRPKGGGDGGLTRVTGGTGEVCSYSWYLHRALVTEKPLNNTRISHPEMRWAFPSSVPGVSMLKIRSQV